ncbi:MAG TPA: hypothetical protein VHV47_07400 [Opitutaceae bacterium]|jgi:hypothetical protein|nr:hypothetical protein [Opitutaceae bacterium]
MNSSMMVWVVLVPIVLWRLYSRVRRNVGEQPYRQRRVIFYVVFFGGATVLAGAACVFLPRVTPGWAAGLILGGALGWVGLRLTRFEVRPEGLFYTPNPHIGVALSLIFAGRLAYRVIALNAQLAVGGRPPPALGDSALTYLVFELLAGYYVCYNLGVLLRCRALAAPPPPA